MKDEELENIFKEAFQGEEGSLPSDLWSGIESDLEKKKKR